MKESEAKNKRCGGPNGCGTLINPAFEGKISPEMRLQFATEFNSPRWCVAADCMMWEAEQWTDEGDCGLKTKELYCNN